MKRQFSRRRNSLIGRSLAGPIAGGLLIVAIFLLLLRTVAPGIVAAVAAPVWQGGNMLAQSVGLGTSFFTDRATLVRERDSLQQEVAALQEAKATSDAKALDLTRLLGDRTETSRGILAGVLARPPVSPYDTFVIDQGSDAGVESGMRVEGMGGTPLGIVESASGSFARVTLYSAPGRETESWVGDARIPMTLLGAGSGAFSATVSRDAGLSEGELVYIASGGARPIGRVSKVESDPSSPRSSVEVTPLTNPFSTTWVTVAP